MEIKRLKLSQVKVNADNPRTITTDKFNKLVVSILVLPKMLEIRPVVVDKTMVALGGNMRLNALKTIASMDVNAICAKLQTSADFVSKSEGERNTLIEYWKNWLVTPTVPTLNASELTESERKQFVIKDNASFGQWDFDALANKWDNHKLNDWGVDVWTPTNTSFQPIATSAPTSSTAAAMPDPSEEDGASIMGDSMPEELQGVDFTPADLPKIEGSDETLMERIIITYPKERKEELMNLLGITSIDKVVYRLDEILPSGTNAAE